MTKDNWLNSMSSNSAVPDVVTLASLQFQLWLVENIYVNFLPSI